MKVVLLADVKGHGKKGDLVEASDGYARNYLLPKGLATEATKGVINELKGKSDAAAYRKEQEKKAAMETKTALESGSVTIVARAGEGGKLFGKVTSQDVADAIKMQLHQVIDKKKIVLPDGIKTIGDKTVDVKLYPEISAKVVVKVVSE
ncbi:MAG: 50S ribosomal protein L9 [Oscillospiraceae bacterium]|nr:50S ribosomal protein L9 [Oscillospiraceae bacterium]